jgi:hypothetical protein
MGTPRFAYRYTALRKIYIPGTTVQLLSLTDKMPCPSFSIAPVETCPGAVFGEGMICQSCYAVQGMYTRPVVQRAQRRRTDYTLQAARDNEAGDDFVKRLVAAIPAAETSYFRIHDSGDLFNVEYVKLWIRIVDSLPQIRFWAPTRMWHSRVNKDIIAAVKELATRENVSVRPSQLAKNAPPPKVEGFDAGTGAIDHDHPGFDGVWVCPASKQGGKCLDCRMCWRKDVPVVYRTHGHQMIQNVRKLVAARKAKAKAAA